MFAFENWHSALEMKKFFANLRKTAAGGENEAVRGRPSVRPAFCRVCPYDKKTSVGIFFVIAVRLPGFVF